MKDVKLVDRDAVQVLARWQNDGANLDNCPAYVRKWITQEGSSK
jgi:hypothetical protein